MGPKPPAKLPPMVQHESNSTGMIIKKFKLGEILGKGSAGTVYKSLNLVTGDIVAIKQVPLRNIPRADLDKIMHEINLLNHLDHANIVKYVDNIKTKDHLNIVLEFVENGSLANTVKKFGSLPESLIAIYIEQVLQGLCFLHSQGVIHRDIKGANILTTKEGHVKLADFGVARRLGEAAVDGRGQDDVAGTPYWMAPEVIEMSPPSTASDIWGVGATIIELLTGSPPYFELSALPALFRIVSDPHPPIPEAISPALRDFLLQCFRKDPSIRLSARKLLEHQWIQTSVARRQARDEGQDWSVVVERTLELHEAARKERKSRGRTSKGKQPTNTTTIVRSTSGTELANGELANTDISIKVDAGRGQGKRLVRSRSDNAVSAQAAQAARRSLQSTEDLFGITQAALSQSGSEFAGDEQDISEWSQGLPSSPISLMAATVDMSKVAPIDTEKSPDPVNVTRLIEDHADHDDIAEDDQIKAAACAATTGPFSPKDDHHGQNTTTMAASDVKSTAHAHMEGDRSANVGGSTTRSQSQSWQAVHVRGGERHNRHRGHDNNHRALGNGGGGLIDAQRGSDLLDLDMDEVFDERGGEQLQSLLQKRLQLLGHMDVEADSDDQDDLFEVTEAQEDVLRVDEASLVEAELLKLMSQLDVRGDEETQVCVCEELESLLRNRSESKTAIMVHHQVLPLLEMLDHTSSLVVLRVLRLVHEAMTERHKKSAVGEYTGGITLRQPLVERMCTVGLLHRLLHHCSADTRDGAAGEEWRMVQQQAALVLHSVCWGRQPHHVQMVIACQGIPVLVSLLSADAPVNHVALECLWCIINLPSPTPKLDLCRLIARGKAAVHLVRLLDRAFSESARLQGCLRDDNSDESGWVNLSWQQADRVASILLLFARGDAVVKADLADDDALAVLLSVIKEGYVTLPLRLQGAYVKLLQALRHLSGEPGALLPLQRAGACFVLVPLLARTSRTPNPRAVASQVQSQAMFALYNLCKVSKERQEQAVTAGIVPHAVYMIQSESPLKQLAIPILCDLAHAGPEPRFELWRNEALRIFLHLLSIKYWQTIALSAIANWIASAEDRSPLEDVLSTPENVEAILSCVDDASTNSISAILAPISRILQQVPRRFLCTLHLYALLQRAHVWFKSARLWMHFTNTGTPHTSTE
jgi:serine/threonine protein kinase